VKHLPGHGRATLDSHKQLPRVGAGMAELAQTDFAPFKALADLPMALTAHIVFDVVDADHPATASTKVIALVRDHIGFDGLLISDDLSMQALSGSIGARAAAAIAAGCDIALHCNGDCAEMVQAVTAAGPVGSAAAQRIDRALQCRHDPETIDTALLEAEFEALVKEPQSG
ncbi:MAG: glycoside hydrolase family 3 N-terminal domain-containing protein, partial [Albidovulum sp.]